MDTDLGDRFLALGKIEFFSVWVLLTHLEIHR